MIRNLLYSLLLHFLLLFAIYASFNLKVSPKAKTSEISVSLVAIAGNQDHGKAEATSNTQSEEQKKEEKKEAPSKAKAPKKSEKNKIKNKAQKHIKADSKQNLSAAKSQEEKSESKPQESLVQKQQEKEKEKQVEALEAQTVSPEENEGDDSADNKNSKAVATNNLENLDLSAREKFNIQSQLKLCYRRAIEESQLRSIATITVKIEISQEGYLNSNLDELLDVNRYNNPADPSYKIAVDNVRRALDLCSPLRSLPLEKYEVWKEAVLEFDAEE